MRDANLVSESGPGSEHIRRACALQSTPQKLPDDRYQKTIQNLGIPLVGLEVVVGMGLPDITLRLNPVRDISRESLRFFTSVWLTRSIVRYQRCGCLRAVRRSGFEAREVLIYQTFGHPGINQGVTRPMEMARSCCQRSSPEGGAWTVRRFQDWV